MHDRLRDPRNSLQQSLDVFRIDEFAGDSDPVIDATEMDQAAVFSQPSQVSGPVAPHTLADRLKPSGGQLRIAPVASCEKSALHHDFAR